MAEPNPNTKLRYTVNHYTPDGTCTPLVSRVNIQIALRLFAVTVPNHARINTDDGDDAFVLVDEGTGEAWVVEPA
jgi:hypothetical protein